MSWEDELGNIVKEFESGFIGPFLQKIILALENENAAKEREV